MALKATVLIAAVFMAIPAAAAAQSVSSNPGQFQAGYGAARYTTARAQTGSTRDENGNRLIVNGLIQSGASAYSNTSGGVSNYGYGVGSGEGATTIGGSTAIGNSLNVVVQGNWNTVIVNSNQINNGDVRAGTALNGTLNLR